MNLPFLKSREPEKNFFLSLLIKPYKVGAILFEEINDKLFILAANETEVETDTAQLSGEELLAACDKVISFVEPRLPDGASVEKTIFSLPYDFIIDSKIKPEYLDRLKTVCQALELVPVGYLTSIEAIVHFIEKNEGAPVSAIFIEAAKSKVFAYHVRAGKILEVLSEPIVENVVGACEKMLAAIQADVLPAKIILLKADAQQDNQQDFLSHKWAANIPFLHVPQVVTLEPGFENEAIINGVAQQMDLEVLSDVARGEMSHKEEEMLEETSGEEFGFVRDDAKKPTGAAEVEKPIEDTIGETEEVDSAKGSRSTGSISSPQASSGQAVEPMPNIKYFKEGDVATESDPATAQKTNLPALNTAAIFGVIKNLKMPSFLKLSGDSNKTKLIAALLGIVLLVIAFLFVYYNFITAANIAIFTDKKAVDKTAGVLFAKDAKGDEISIKVLEEEAKSEDTKNSTGKKETGDKARGSVTIYNKSEDKKTFSKGTIIVGPNNLEFELVDDVSIASTSPFSTSLTSATSKVTASKFGKEYNLPSASNFTVKGFSASQFIAKNSDAIIGGTSKSTTVVAQKDLDDLLSEAIAASEKDEISKAVGAAQADESVLPKALSATVVSKKYTKKAGDEAGSVGITLTVKFGIAKYKKRDVQKYVEEISKNGIPATFVLKEDESKAEIEDVRVTKDGSGASAKLKINAVYSPLIDPAKLASALKGKSLSSAEKQIKDITGVTEVMIMLSRSLPLLPQLLPLNAKNINIEVKN